MTPWVRWKPEASQEMRSSPGGDLGNTAWVQPGPQVPHPLLLPTTCSEMPSAESDIPELLSQGSGSLRWHWAGGVPPSGLSQWIP